MPPIWEPDDQRSTIYDKVQKHSEGMISFAYEPPSEADLQALKSTETYQTLQRELQTIINAAPPAPKP
jgi:hypothetical protein